METFSWRPSSLVRKFKFLFKIITEAADAGVVVGSEAAKFQSETGVLGQTGFGGGGWNPEDIDAELAYLGAGMGPGVF